MAERKVLNKRYPPDFDPAKVPKGKVLTNRSIIIRLMVPFNIRCNSCGEYIYKGKKFNSREETVKDEEYLGLKIFRFYIKCPSCSVEIVFKTDPQNTDYTLEAGATRLFEAEKLAQKMAEQERKEKEEEELNPMKVLENCTKQSRNELEQLDTLEELRDLNARHARLNFEDLIGQHQALTAQERERQEEEDTKMARELLSLKRKQPLPDPDEEGLPSRKQKPVAPKPADVPSLPPSTKKTVEMSNKKAGRAALVILKKKPNKNASSLATAASSTSTATSSTATAASSTSTVISSTAKTSL